MPLLNCGSKNSVNKNLKRRKNVKAVNIVIRFKNHGINDRVTNPEVKNHRFGAYEIGKPLIPQPKRCPQNTITDLHHTPKSSRFGGCQENDIK